MNRTGLFIVLCAAVMFSGCAGNVIDIEQFKTMDEPGLYIKGKNVISYDEKTWQVGFNESKAEFRLFDDNMADFIVVTCRSFPESGKTVKADILYTTVDDVKEIRNVSLRVAREDTDSGKIWLYSDKNDVSAIVYRLR